MKALRLELSAFGPYAGRQIFDFRELGGNAFFLIHGPTGSGKSSILDGICHALYGDTSGGDRSAAEMRSHHADPDTLTEVIFEFEIAENHYRIRRVPEQQRPKKRGKGYTTQQPDAEFHRINADGSSVEVIASGVSKVTEAAEEIIGFRSDQFRQVVVLAQGKFREFLSADTAGREEILELLFRTERYRDIQDALKKAAKEITTRHDALKQQEEIILGQAGVENRDQLQAQRDDAAEKVKKTATELSGLRTAETVARKALETGRNTVEKLKDAAEAGKALDSLEKQKGEMAALEKKLARAGRASGLVDAEADRNTRQKEHAAAVSDRENGEKALKAAREAHAAALARLEEEKTKETEREEARIEADRLHALTEKAADLQEAFTAFKDTEKEKHQLEKKLDQSRKHCIDREAYIRTLEEKAAAFERTAAQLDARKQKLAAAEARLDQQNGILAVEKKLKPLREYLEKAEKSHTDREKAFAAAVETALEMETAWREGRAVALARTLEEGKPCPVCGSIDHPSPADSDEAPPSEEELEEAQQQRDKLRNDVEKNAGEVNRIQREITAYESELKTRLEAAGDAATRSPEKLKVLVKAARDEVAQAEAASRDAAALRESLAEELKAQKTECENRDELEKAFLAASRQCAETEAVVREREKAVPEALRAPDALQRAVKESTVRYQKLVQVFETARHQESKCREATAAAESALKAARESEKKAAVSARTAAEVFDRRLGEAGFDEEGDYQASRLEQSAMDKLGESLNAWKEALAAAEDRAKRAAAKARDLAAPDLVALEKAAEKAASEADACTTRKANEDNRLALIQNQIGQLDESAEKRDRLDAEYRNIGEIARVAGGDNSLKLSFQRFVLASRLDDVLAAASVRLSKMSQGRYVLNRAEKTIDGRRAGGLDLEVFDSYTGEKRSVNTLSGGEGFLASLALALGLADVVQSYAGGIRLDTLFIDEGFGSLDPESLDRAIETLMHLRRDGRIVGVISHVPELKERIDVRLEIQRGRNGSTAVFHH